jgi:hypothetical protein
MMAQDYKPGAIIEWYDYTTGTSRKGVVGSGAPWTGGRWVQDSEDGTLWGLTVRKGTVALEYPPNRVQHATEQLNRWYQEQRPRLGYDHSNAHRDALRGARLVA